MDIQTKIKLQGILQKLDNIRHELMTIPDSVIDCFPEGELPDALLFVNEQIDSAFSYSDQAHISLQEFTEQPSE